MIACPNCETEHPTIPIGDNHIIMCECGATFNAEDGDEVVTEGQ